MADELKPLIEQGNKIIESIRSEVEGMKSADVLTEQKLARMESDLALALKAKQDAELAQKAMEARLSDIEAKSNRPGAAKSEEVAEHKAAFFEFMRKGENGGAGAKLFDLQSKATDVRVATPASGGYALPKEIASAVLSLVQDISPIRQIAHVVQVGSTDYHEIVSGNGFGTEWVGETSTRNQTNTPDFFDIAPTFGELAAKPEVTRHSLSDLFFSVESWLVNEAAKRFAMAEGTAFVSGDGTNKPTGFLAGPTPLATADASRAFGTLQYVPTGQAAALATAPFDTFKDLVYTLKAGYRANARFVMNSTMMATLAKVRDAEGVYLLQRSVADASPDRIEGKPITISEDMPNVAAGTFPVAFGDFDAGYLIADVAGMWMIRDELTKTGWVKFPMSKRVGGKLRDTQAIKLLKVAAS